jgi:hypothetical protein
VSAITITELQQTCVACPSQWEGRLADGRALYIRYRHGYLRANAADTRDGAISYGSADLKASVEVLFDSDKQPPMSDEQLMEWTHERARVTREAILGGQMLYHERVGDALDGMMETEEMLSRLEGVGVANQVGVAV